MGALLQQAQAMQEQLMAAQAELEQSTVEGTAGGLVTVTVSGTGELSKVDVKTGSFDPDIFAIFKVIFPEIVGTAEEAQQRAGVS